MNADRIAETPAQKSLTDPEIIGTIIINIQQTRLDSISALRIWGKLDEVFTVSQFILIFQIFKFSIFHFSFYFILMPLKYDV